MTHPSVSIVFFTEFAIIVVVKGWIAFDTLLFTQLMVLAFGAIHSSIHNLKSDIKIRIKTCNLIPIQHMSKTWNMSKVNKLFLFPNHHFSKYLSSSIDHTPII